MITEAMRARFEQALLDGAPENALFSLAQALKSDGVPQVTIYRLFSEYQQKVCGDDPVYDAVVDNMDRIWGGPWAKGSALFDVELTDANVKGVTPGHSADEGAA